MEATHELPDTQPALLRTRYHELLPKHGFLMLELTATKDEKARNKIKSKIRPIQQEIHLLRAKIKGSKANDPAVGIDFHSSAAIATASASEHQAGSEEATSWGEPDPDAKVHQTGGEEATSWGQPDSGAKNTWCEPGFGAKETWDYPDFSAKDNQASEVEFAPSITPKELINSPLTNHASNSSEWATPLKAIQLNFPSNPLYILWT